jgi:hypothetical protein
MTPLFINIFFTIRQESVGPADWIEWPKNIKQLRACFTALNLLVLGRKIAKNTRFEAEKSK